MQIKGHKKVGEKKRNVPWPRHEILKHIEGKCPHCHKHLKNVEEHIKDMHMFEKPKPIKGKVHGHD